MVLPGRWGQDAGSSTASQGTATPPISARGSSAINPSAARAWIVSAASGGERGRCSMKTGLVQPFENMVARLLCAELSGENPCIEERGEAHGDNALAFSILVSSHLGVGGRKKRTGEHLGAVARSSSGKAARKMRCRAITRSPRPCALTSMRPALPRTARAGCSAPRAGTKPIRCPSSP